MYIYKVTFREPGEGEVSSPEELQLTSVVMTMVSMLPLIPFSDNNGSIFLDLSSSCSRFKDWEATSGLDEVNALASDPLNISAL